MTAASVCRENCSGRGFSPGGLDFHKAYLSIWQQHHAVRHTVKTGRDELGADAASLFDRLDQLLFYLFFSHGRILSMGSANSKAA